MAKKRKPEQASKEIGTPPDLDNETIQKMRGLSKGEIGVIKIFPNPETIEERVERAFQVIQKGINPIFNDNLGKRKLLRERETKIKELTPHAKRGKQVLQGSKKSGKKKNEVNRKLRKLYQREAERIWERRHNLSKLAVGQKIAKGIADLNKEWDDGNPLSEIATLLSDNDRELNENTIRRIIHKPLHKKHT